MVAISRRRQMNSKRLLHQPSRQMNSKRLLHQPRRQMNSAWLLYQPWTFMLLTNPSTPI
jgi:hypothetical protein